MKWKDIFEELGNERAVFIGFEAVLSTQLRCVVGDIPIYNIVAQYFSKDSNGQLETRICKDISELKDIIEKEPAFLKCNECGELLVKKFICDNERQLEYCSIQCLTKEMNQIHGEEGWRLLEPSPSEELNNIQHIKIQIKENQLDNEIKEVWRPYNIELIETYL